MNTKPPYTVRRLTLIDCIVMLQDVKEGLRQAATRYHDPHGALDEALSCIDDALIDITATAAIDAAGGCTCDHCEEIAERRDRDTML